MPLVNAVGYSISSSIFMNYQSFSAGDDIVESFPSTVEANRRFQGSKIIIYQFQVRLSQIIVSSRTYFKN